MKRLLKKIWHNGSWVPTAAGIEALVFVVVAVLTPNTKAALLLVAYAVVCAFIFYDARSHSYYEGGYADGHHEGWHHGVDSAAQVQGLDVLKLEESIAEFSGDEHERVH